MARYKKKLMRAPLVCNLSALGMTAIFRNLLGTLEYKAAFYDRGFDPVNLDPRKTSCMYIGWHEYITHLVYHRGNCEISMLLSPSRDAEIMARTAQLMGFDTVRGSTSSSGHRALRQLFRISKSRHIGIAPDGPRGPRRVLSSGPIYAASRLQMPILAVGIGYDRPWRFNSWDCYAAPRPFSRGRCVVGPPVLIPRRLDRTGIEEYRLKLQRLLNQVTHEAETWAVAGTARRGQFTFRRESRRKHRVANQTWVKREDSFYISRAG